MIELRTFPLKQGDLDWLCSVYAAINLRNLRGTLQNAWDADELFMELMTNHLPKRNWSIGKYVSQGVDPDDDVVELFEGAGFSCVEPVKCDVETIKHECRQRKGVLIFIKEIAGDEFSHYTIATTARENGNIELWDSWKFAQLEHVEGAFKAKGLRLTIAKAWRIVG